MASNLSTVGFAVNSQDAMYDLAMRAAKEGQWVETKLGRYVRWADGSGAEIWLQVNRDDQIIGFSPHFSGPTRMLVGLTERIKRPQDTKLDGAFHGWANPSDDQAESGYYPFVFDSPDAAFHQALVLPRIVRVQLAAFAHELAAFPDEQAYYAEQKEHQHPFAAESFVPTGLFSQTSGETVPPPAEAIFAGRILHTEMLTNAFTQSHYLWAQVRTLGGEIDVVVDPAIVKGDLVVGGTLTGSFWLSGRLQE